MSYYREQLEKWLSRQEIEAKDVLDIGGSANVVDNRVDKWKVKNYKILDNNAERTYHDDDKWRNPDFYLDLNMEWDKDNHPGRYDAVFCLEVFEYIFDPVRAINNIHSCLKRNGIAYISFPTIYPVHNPVDKDYLRYTKAGVERLLASGGFDSWEITPREATTGWDALRTFYVQEGMRAARNEPAVFDIGYMVRAFNE